MMRRRSAVPFPSSEATSHVTGIPSASMTALSRNKAMPGDMSAIPRRDRMQKPQGSDR